jgi:hypothetical protein
VGARIWYFVERRLFMLMHRIAMARTILATVVALAALETTIRAQWIPAGSTPEGDYMRGLGIAAWGLGLYNVNTAQAESIDADTWIRLDTYIGQVAENSARKYAERRAAESAHNKEQYEKIRQRIRESPEERDVENGDALNDVLQQMLDGRIDDSSFRFAPLQVALSVDVIRKIPFKLSEKGEKFSMNRLTAKGKKKWPVAFQDDRFNGWREAYERAVDKALEQAVDGKLQGATIDDLQVKAEDLLVKLNQVFGPSNEPRYIEAKQRVAELKLTARLLTRHKIELAIGEIDKYSGTTVRDLMLFMQAHNLRFAATENPEERRLYPELYAALKQQQEKLPPQKLPAK